MKIILLLAIVILLLYYFYSRLKNMFGISLDPFTSNDVRLIHLIYFPWDPTTQKLKDDSNDFDRTAFQQLQESHPEYNVKMWTLDDCKKFVKKFYPSYESIIFNAPRPVMMVDILRLLIVYHYGGIYWQYGSKPLVGMEQFLPNSPSKNVKLFTEVMLTPEFSNEMRKEPIRRGEPEERVRVCTQIFSAIARHPYMFELFKTAVENMQAYPIQRDYDILYTTGNAMMSTVYDKVGKHRNDIELVGVNQLSTMAFITSNGSWRIKKIS